MHKQLTTSFHNLIEGGFIGLTSTVFAQCKAGRTQEKKETMLRFITTAIII